MILQAVVLLDGTQHRVFVAVAILQASAHACQEGYQVISGTPEFCMFQQWPIPAKTLRGGSPARTVLAFYACLHPLLTTFGNCEHLFL